MYKGIKMHVASPRLGYFTNDITMVLTKRKILNWETHSHIGLTCKKRKITNKTKVTIIGHQM